MIQSTEAAAAFCRLGHFLSLFRQSLGVERVCVDDRSDGLVKTFVVDAYTYTPRGLVSTVINMYLLSKNVR